jgi:hypothetical protein
MAKPEVRLLTKDRINKKIDILKRRSKRTRETESQRFIEGQINALLWCRLNIS